MAGRRESKKTRKCPLCGGELQHGQTAASFFIDSLARDIVRLQSLRFTGTAGVLLKVKQKGLISELKPVFYRLKDAGFYLREKVLIDLLRLSGEA